MLAPPIVDPVLNHPTQAGVLGSEVEFYQSYDWCLNPYVTVSEAMEHLRDEAARLVNGPNDWRGAEVATNIYLLSCGLLNCVEEYLRGPALRLPSSLARTVPGRSAGRLVEVIWNKPWLRRRVARWRERWLANLNGFLVLMVRREAAESVQLFEAAHKLVMVLQSPLPSDLLAERLGVPTAFSRLDLTQQDFVTLAKSFVQRFSERTQPILVVGLRSSGSYLAPFLKAFFQAEGYERVQLLTIEPNKGVGRREKRELERFGARGYLALIVDDPPYTSRTVLAALEIAIRAGFSRGKVKFLAATHPARREWFKSLPCDSVITLPPEQWHKRKLFDPRVVEVRLAEYCGRRHLVRVLADGASAEAFNAGLKGIPSDERGVRLKRVFEVQLETSEGDKQTKYVLAKSVGWGWFGYHAFLIGHRLAGHVSPILGLRDGILYMEWSVQRAHEAGTKRSELVSAAASYVAARARHLRLRCGNVTGIGLKRYNNGIQLLEKVLSRAYGPVFTHLLMRSRLRQILQERPCPCPTLIDGNMHRHEWVSGPYGPIKVDFEHHGMGKAALNLIDPAYDLADTILNCALSPEEERALISGYIAGCGDAGVEQRLFMHKLLAGLWAMNEVQDQFFSSPRGGDAQRAYHKRFMNAWHFLTVQTAYHCGALCQSRTELRWLAPLVALDIDGVLDRRLFGFPCTTAAGMAALSLLNAHEFTVALNTARSVAEVKHYCKAYSLAGGIAEHGSCLWDAVHQREKILISPETARQLNELRQHLNLIPGVFLDDRHQYSIRAFTYRDKPLGLIQSLLSSARASSIGDGALGPISTHIVHQLLVDLNLDRLAFYHTPLDTAIVAKEVDKGTGLVALRDWVLQQDAKTIAVGDGEADLAMFRAASHSFAPANVGCRRQAQLLGCQIAVCRDQQGLLEIVRKIIQSDKDHGQRRKQETATLHCADDLFISVLHAADQTPAANFFRAMLDPRAYKFFIRA
jgi:hydroxymethylpyrimidine pyrophosphatase-like HAD family hydrolase